MKKLLALFLSVWLTVYMTGCMGWLLSDTGEQAANPQFSAARVDTAGGDLGRGTTRAGDSAAYTLLIYLNGADLETEGGSASDDLLEMVQSSYNRQDINVVVQTGGSLQWHIDGIPSNALGRYIVAEDTLDELETLPLQNMTDPDTLSDFINYGYANFPAEKYGLILWDHGGGPVFGFGMDQHFEDDTLYLEGMERALANSAAAEKPLELLGFDACLMGNLEVAHMLSPYTRYYVASQETEPGYGWYYTGTLDQLGANPGMDGGQLGQAIVDNYFDFYEYYDMGDLALTLSVVDTGRTGEVVDALENLVSAADINQIGFQQVARNRSNTKEFGIEQGDYSMSYDLVDLGDLAGQFGETNPAEANALATALDAAVVYSAYGQYVSAASGMSLYFPYYQQDYIDEIMDIYRGTGFSPTYYNYLADFVGVLTGEVIAPMDTLVEVSPEFDETVPDDTYHIYLTQEQLANIDTIYFAVWQHLEGDVYRQIYQDTYVEVDTATGQVLTEFEGYITTINGEAACLYETDWGEGYTRYQVPAVLNGVDVNLEVLFDSQSPDGRVLGATPVYQQTSVASRQLWQVEAGDQLAMSYYTEEFADAGSGAEYAEGDGPYWYDGDTFTVQGDLVVETVDVPAGEYLYGFVIVDLQGNTYETDYIAVDFWYE